MNLDKMLIWDRIKKDWIDYIVWCNQKSQRILIALDDLKNQFTIKDK